MSDAITHYRQLREFTRDELSYVLEMAGYPLSADAIGLMENRERGVTVDDLVALAHALDTTPAVMLAHIPIDMPAPEGPLATGLPADVDQAELRAWIEGKTTLDHDARVRWCEEKVSRLRVRSAHIEEQLQGAYAEIRELGELMEQEADALPVQMLHAQVREGQYALNQVELALALAEQKLDGLQQSTL
ncbi:DNA-binding protein [Streptomyces sp. MMS24-I29]|uniref:DNA-binding protein n=1 Tax=Streptomyces sp. MMS24-I29 TaxID=3351480 RepID=UPI003C7B7FCB